MHFLILLLPPVVLFRILSVTITIGIITRFNLDFYSSTWARMFVAHIMAVFAVILLVSMPLPLQARVSQGHPRPDESESGRSVPS